MSGPALTEHVAFKAQSGFKSRLDFISRLNGRGPSEELRCAFELHALETMRAYCDTPAGAAELGDNLQRTREHVAREIERWRSIAYVLPRGSTHPAISSYVPN